MFGRRAWALLDRWALVIGAAFEREVELGRAVLWLPVLFGAGIVTYFGLPREPSLVALTVILGAVVGVAWKTRRRVVWFRFWVAVAAVVGGTAVMKARTDIVAAPILAETFVGDLSGWVEEIEEFGPNDRRLVVRVSSLEGIEAADTPFRVRISVRGQFDDVSVGAGIGGLVSLQTPPGPIMPGGYDFGRDLFYERIGASGFAYGPPDLVDIGPPPFGLRLKVPIANLRSAVGDAVAAVLPGETGHIATALITGDRGEIPEETSEALRQSGLGHILAISGLHMALVAGGVFAFLRGLFALSPSLALKRPIKKWAAIGAFVAATSYLVLSGASIATQRSFIMLGVMLFAVLLDRRAFSVRNVAVAAAIVLVLTPEAILSASFQMSFAATLALIAGFEVISERRRQRLAIGPAPERSAMRFAFFWIGGLLLTSLLAGLATAPFAAFHFNRTAPLSLLANLAAMPVLSLVVMPAALIGTLLIPFGLDQWAFKIMDGGLTYVVSVAETVSEWTGSSGLVAAAPGIAIVLVAIGLVWLCLWRTRLRLAGLPIMALGILVTMTAARPDVLINDTSDVVAVRSAEGLYQIIGSVRSFEAENWLRADADARTPGAAELAEGVTCDSMGCTALIAATGLRIALSEEQSAFVDDCRLAAIVVTALAAPDDCTVIILDGNAIGRGGAHAIYVEEREGGSPVFRIVATRPETRRPWMPPLADQ